MKIAILGYGKMGREIEKLALEHKHQLILKIDSEEDWEKMGPQLKDADVAIEFSMPGTVISNIKKCFAAGIPVVVGTTGWHEQESEITALCNNSGQSMFFAANFNIGVNIFFEINKRLAALMNHQTQYHPYIEEIHHLQKIDQPSGTAIKLARDMIHALDRKSLWVNTKPSESKELEIKSLRIDEVPGNHIVRYASDNDMLEIRHEAKNRKGFAQGALMAAAWLMGKKGVYGMHDLLGI
ncbi:MAG: 4-hydroxy-tetrahydrodipicolinate reductase [Bacteroidota bacterium]|nr:4-hydroxy-tetrahydrodipicolinate reductase [Bacteroidota bacterium]